MQRFLGLFIKYLYIFFKEQIIITHITPYYTNKGYIYTFNIKKAAIREVTLTYRTAAPTLLHMLILNKLYNTISKCMLLIIGSDSP